MTISVDIRQESVVFFIKIIAKFVSYDRNKTEKHNCRSFDHQTFSKPPEIDIKWYKLELKRLYMSIRSTSWASKIHQMWPQTFLIEDLNPKNHKNPRTRKWEKAILETGRDRALGMSPIDSPWSTTHVAKLVRGPGFHPKLPGALFRWCALSPPPFAEEYCGRS